MALLDAVESHVVQAALLRLNSTLLPGKERFGKTYYQALEQALGEKDVSYHLSGQRGLFERMLHKWHRDGGKPQPPPLPLETQVIAHGGRRETGNLLGSGDQSATRDASVRHGTEAEAGLAEDPSLLAILTSGGGEPLPEALQARMNRRFGHDFRHVRIHADATSEKAAERLGARALTLGRHIYFGAGQFAPETPTGDRLRRPVKITWSSLRDRDLPSL